MESKTLTSIDILEHRAVMKFCVHGGEFPIKRSLMLRFYSSRVYSWNYGFKVVELVFWALAAHQPPIYPGSCTLCKLETAWTEISGPKWSTRCHNRHYTTTWLKGLNFKNKSDSFAFHVTRRRGDMKWCSVHLSQAKLKPL